MRYSPNRKIELVEYYCSSEDGKWYFNYLDDWGVLTNGDPFDSEAQAVDGWKKLNEEME